MAETLRSGGLEYEAGWLKCQAVASFKSGEARIFVDSVNTGKLGFFVDVDLVKPQSLPKALVDGEVKVIVVGRNGGTSRVSVPGEPESFGPQIVVRNELLT